MKALDSHYLELQFMERVFKLTGNQFQTFFENIFTRKYEDFERIRTYGNRGDGGNDGYNRAGGIYYQVYSPLNPETKDAEAAQKMRVDFEKLYEKWNHLTPIQEFNFLFNDNYTGISIVLAEMLSALEKDYPGISFKIITSEKLQRIFMSLDEASLLALNFNIDTRQALELATSILDRAAIEIERESIGVSRQLLQSCDKLLSSIDSEDAVIRSTILSVKCDQKEEKWGLAESALEKLYSMYPESLQVLIALGELKLALDKYDENLSYLNAAIAIEESNAELKLAILSRKVHLHEQVDKDDDFEKELASTPRMLSSYFRLISLLNFHDGDIETAKLSISQAIQLNPNRFDNYRLELEYNFMEAKGLKEKDLQQVELGKIEVSLNELIENFGGRELLPARTLVYTGRLQADILYLTGEAEKFQEVAFQILLDCQDCYLNKGIEFVLMHIMAGGKVHVETLTALCEYVVNSKSEIGIELSKALVLQFSLNGILYEQGEEFFRTMKCSSIIELIERHRANDAEYLKDFVKSDPEFAVAFLGSAKKYSKEIEDLIDAIEIDEITKEKLKFHLLCESGDLAAAFDIAKTISIDRVGLFEIDHFLEVANKSDAWDLELDLIARVIDIKGNGIPVRFRVSQFNALLKSGKHSEAISIGKDILAMDSSDELLSLNNKKYIFEHVMSACYEKSKYDVSFVDTARELIEVYGERYSGFNTKIGYLPGILCKIGKHEDALVSISNAIVEERGLTQNEYARLFFMVCIEIGNHIDFKGYELESIEAGCFVKMDGDCQWYRVGGEAPLDAVHITPDSHLYQNILDKKPGDSISFISEIEGAEIYESISEVLSLKGYIVMKVRQAFQKLAPKELLPGVHQFTIKEQGGRIDEKHLVQTLESLSSSNDAIFSEYKKSVIPFAFLAVNEGGFIGAIGKILGEQAGYINFSDGSLNDYASQVEKAKELLASEKLVYLDGTSAAFLAEFSIFRKVVSQLPGLKIPQSVVGLLSSLAERFTPTADSPGMISVRKGAIVYSETDSARLERVKSAFLAAINECEDNPGLTVLLSNANKSDDTLENGLPPEFVDASILARRNDGYLITDDQIYLRAAEIVLSYEKIDHISSLALIRAMYELGLISFSNYLEYFGFVSTYRFRFLSISPADITKAILGDGLIQDFRPENLDHFNFPYTLSVEYGVSADELVRVLSNVLFGFLIDDSIPEEIYGRIVLEIMSRLPSDTTKLDVLNLIIKNCEESAKNNQQAATIKTNPEGVRSKLVRLKNTRAFY